MRHRIGVDDTAIPDDILVTRVGDIFVTLAEIEPADIAAADAEIILGIGGCEVLADRLPLQARLRIGPGGEDTRGRHIVCAFDGEGGMEGTVLFLHDVYALQDRARLLHEEIDSKLSSETNRHLYILSIMTAFLLPPTLVTGFFGMNTANLPFAIGDHGTEYAIGLIIASIVFAWWLLKRVHIL